MNGEPAGAAPDADAVVVVTLVDGEPQLHSAAVVGREQAVLRVETATPVVLGPGSVVGVLRGGSTEPLPGAVALALVSDTIGDRIAELRVLDRRS